MSVNILGERLYPKLRSASANSIPSIDPERSLSKCLNTFCQSEMYFHSPENSRETRSVNYHTLTDKRAERWRLPLKPMLPPEKCQLHSQYRSRITTHSCQCPIARPSPNERGVSISEGDDARRSRGLFSSIEEYNDADTHVHEHFDSIEVKL